MDLNPSINSAASAIVRKAEDLNKMDEIEKRRMEDAKRLREQALREAAARRRTAETSGR